MPEEFEYELENFIDKSSLSDVLESLVEICYAKAEHLRSNWQDSKAAKSWDRDAAVIGRMVSKIQN